MCLQRWIYRSKLRDHHRQVLVDSM
jgi:hypothetical protein